MTVSITVPGNFVQDAHLPIASAGAVDIHTLGIGQVPPRTFKDWRSKSLLRANILVGAAVLLTTRFVDLRALERVPLLVLPLFLMLLGTVDTARCLRKRWNWYHGGVLLLLYADLMAITMLLFFLVYPYLI